MEFVQDMVEKGQCSEADAQKTMRNVLGNTGMDLLGDYRKMELGDESCCQFICGCGRCLYCT